MNVRDLPPEEVLQSSKLPEYRKRMRIFSDELVYLHTNLSIVRQINDFNFRLFQAPAALFSYVSRNLMSQCVLIVTRLWGDARRDVVTLDEFIEWLPNSVKRTHRKNVEALLKHASPSKNIRDLIDSLRKVRHAEVAHLGRKVKLGLKTRPTSLNLPQMEEIADCLGVFYNNANFGSETAFVIAQLEAPGGEYHEGELGYVFDRLALGSNWFRVPQKHPELWPKFRAKISDEELEQINAVGRRHQKEPLK